jgi:hypothetical protein
MRSLSSDTAEPSTAVAGFRWMYPFCAPLLEPIFGYTDVGSVTGGVLEELLNAALDHREPPQDARRRRD